MKIKVKYSLAIHEEIIDLKDFGIEEEKWKDLNKLDKNEILDSIDEKFKSDRFYNIHIDDLI